MSWSALAFAFLAGNLAAVNPCGFVMLPAFAGYVLTAGGEERTPTWVRLGRALRLGMSVTAAFVAVFAVAGVVTELGGRPLLAAWQWLAVPVGVLLIGYGLWVLAGRAPGGVRLPNPAHSRGSGSALLFGAGYGIVSLACTLPVFLSVVGVALTVRGGALGLTAFVAYALGMGTVVLAVAVAVALAQERLVAGLRRAGRHATRVGGALLALVGVYVIGYALYAPVVGGPVVVEGAPAPITWVTRASAAAMNWLASANGRIAVGTAAVALLAAAGAAVLARRGRRTRAALEDDTAAAAAHSDGKERRR